MALLVALYLVVGVTIAVCFVRDEVDDLAADGLSGVQKAGEREAVILVYLLTVLLWPLIAVVGVIFEMRMRASA